jgi:hypothetical protein
VAELPEIRALTVRVPWSHLIAFCGKTIENRSQEMRYRGLLAIHAGSYARWDRAAERSPAAVVAWRRWAASLPPPNLPGRLRRDAAHITFSAVIAVATVAGCHHSDECMPPEAPGAPGTRPGCSPWAIRGQWHIELAGVRPLADPVPCRGQLGLWRLPEDAERAVREQLAEASRG